MKTKILILGARMLGNTLLRYFSMKSEFQVFATIRGDQEVFNIGDKKKYQLFTNIERNHNNLVKANEAQPHVVVNCVGIIKQLPESCDPVLSIALNSLLPHRLAQLCASKVVVCAHKHRLRFLWRWRYIESDVPMPWIYMVVVSYWVKSIIRTLLRFEHQ